MTHPHAFFVRVARAFPLLALLALVPSAAHAAKGPEMSVVVQFMPGSQQGHGFELARARVYYQFVTSDGYIWVDVRYDPSSLQNINRVYYFNGRPYTVNDVNSSTLSYLRIEGRGMSGGSVGDFATTAHRSFSGSLRQRLDRLDAHLSPMTKGARYPEEYVQQFLQTLSLVVDQLPPLTTLTADQEVQRQLREAANAERAEQQRKEREEREARLQQEKAEREAQAAREKAAREAQRQQDQAQREAQRQQAEQRAAQERASSGAATTASSSDSSSPADGSSSSSSSSAPSAPLTREQRQALAQEQRVQQQLALLQQQQAQQEARAQAQQRAEEQRAEEQQRAREALVAQQEQARLDAAEREAKAQEFAEAAAPLAVAGIQALDEMFSGMDSGLPDFRDVALGCQLSQGFTPGCSVQLRIGAFFYVVMGGGYTAAPKMQSTIYSRQGFQSGTRVGVTEAAVSSWFAELGAGLNIPIDDDWKVMVDVAPFLGAGSVKPAAGFSEEAYSLTLFGFSGSVSGWYKIPNTEYQVGLRYRLQGVGLGFAAEDEDKDLLASEDYYQSSGTMTRELRKDFDEGGMFSSLGVQFAVPF